MKYPKNDLEELYKLHEKYNNINKYFKNNNDNRYYNFEDNIENNIENIDYFDIWRNYKNILGHSPLLNMNLIKKMLNDKIIEKTDKHFWIVVCLFQKIPLEYIKNNSDIEWKWSYISQNHNIISFDDVIKNPDLPFNMSMVSRNLNIKWNHVIENIHLNWDWDGLSRNSNIKIEHIISLPEKQWNWEFICYTCDIKKIQWHHIKDNPSLPWKWNSLLQCDNLPLEIIINIEKTGLITDWDLLSDNVNLTMDFIEQHLDKEWNWNSLSCHNNITFEFILKHYKNWMTSDIFYNPNITFEQIKNYKELNWNVISSQSFITWNHIKENLHLPWNWKRVTFNKNITIEIIINAFHSIEHLNYYDFDWDEINSNKKINSDIIKQNHDLPWDWKLLSNNKNITWELLYEFPNQSWNYYNLLRNDFNYNTRLNVYYIWKSRDRAARIIQRGCTNWIDKPVTADGKYGISIRIGMKALFNC